MNTDKFYYNCLSESEREIYDALLDGLQKHSFPLTLELKKISFERVAKVYEYISFDYPFLPFPHLSFEGNATRVIASLNGVYPKAVPTEIIDDIVNKISNAFNNGDREYRSVISALFKLYYNLFLYRAMPVEAPSVENLLVNKYGNCVAFSRLTKAVFDRLGIPCVCVACYIKAGRTTLSKDKVRHLFNAIYNGSEWIFIDPTTPPRHGTKWEIEDCRNGRFKSSYGSFDFTNPSVWSLQGLKKIYILEEEKIWKR